MLLVGLLMGCPGRSSQTQTPPGPVEPEQTTEDPTPEPTPVATGEDPAGDTTAPQAPEKDEDAAGQQTSSADRPGQGQPCPKGHCRKGLSCLAYYGIAGPQGPKFTSCEISCIGNPSVCPKGQHCITIADGPGQVCRPR